MTLTKDDLKAISTLLDTEVPRLVEKVTEPYFQAIQKDLGQVVTTMDEFLQIVRRHEQEWLILRTQHTKMRDLLIKKGLATEDELAVA